jgi:hypothetical protein
LHAISNGKDSRNEDIDQFQDYMSFAYGASII